MEKLREYKNRPVLVTGASGYLGSALVVRLKSLGAVVNTLKFSDRRTKNEWPERVKGQEIIFHLAAQTNHKIAERDVDEDWKTNCESFLHLLNACKERAPKARIVFASTVTVGGVDDSMPPTFYDLHKLCNEGYLNLFLKNSSLSGVVLRLANVFGPSPGVSKEGRGILNWMVAEAIRRQELTILESGEWMRDYVYIDDVIEAFLLAGVMSPSTEGSAKYDVVTGVGTQFVDAVKLVANLVQKKTGNAIRINFDHSKSLSAIEKRNFVGDVSRLKEALQWTPKIDLHTGLEKLVADTCK